MLEHAWLLGKILLIPLNIYFRIKKKFWIFEKKIEQSFVYPPPLYLVYYYI